MNLELKMRRASTAFAMLLGLCCAAPGAAQELIGVYEGSFELEATVVRQRAHPRAQFVTLEISSVEGRKVAGTWRIATGACKGSYPIEGNYKDNRLALKIARTASGDCGGSAVRLTVTGSRLEGTFGKYPIHLSR